MDTKEKILKCAEELFRKFGIRSVTMDDVARDVSMSKKTLYQYIENKDRLVREVVLFYVEKDREEFSEIEKEAEDAVHELLLVSRCLREHVAETNPSTLYDMQKYHVDAWNEYLKFKDTTIRAQLERNINKGIEEGHFRPEIDAKMLSIMRVEQVEMVFDRKTYPPDEFNFVDVQLQILDHFIHGLLTDKGREKYQEYINTER